MRRPLPEAAPEPMSETFAISLSGTTDLPAGKIAAIVTSLEMLSAPALKADPPGVEGFSLDEIGREDVQRYLAVYRLLGERWMWFSRLVKPVAELQAILADPLVEFFAVRFGGRDVGLLELDFRVEGEGELTFFGLDESVVGKGAGRWLMNRALERAWARRSPGSGCIPARSTIRARSSSISVRASRRSGAASRWSMIRALAGRCRAAPSRIVQ
jgi:GNAT superfamily N-acetyltransferase